MGRGRKCSSACNGICSSSRFSLQQEILDRAVTSVCPGIWKCNYFESLSRYSGLVLWGDTCFGVIWLCVIQHTRSLCNDVAQIPCVLLRASLLFSHGAFPCGLWGLHGCGTLGAVGARLRAFTWETRRPCDAKHWISEGCKLRQGKCRVLVILTFSAWQCLQSEPKCRKRWLLFSADGLGTTENGRANSGEGDAQWSPLSTLLWDNKPSSSLHERSAI